MKRKKLLILAALILLLTAVGITIRYILNNTEDPDAEDTIYAVNRLREEFDSCVIQNDTGTFSVRADKDSETGYYCELVDGLPQLRSNYVLLVDDLVCLKAAFKYEKADISRYGLDDPCAVAEVKLKDGTEYTVCVGADSPSDNYTYYTVSDHPDTVYAVKRSMFLYYKEDVYFLVNRLLAPFTGGARADNDPTDIADWFEFTNASGEKFRVEHLSEPYEDGAGQRYAFRQTAPEAGYCDAARVQGYFSRLMQFCGSSAIVKSPSGEDMKRYGLDDPDTVMTIGYGDDQAVIRLSKAEGSDYYAYKEGVDAIWIVADYLVNWLDMEPRAMLSDYLLAPRMEDVDSFTVEAYGKEYRFAVTDDGRISHDSNILDDQSAAKLYELVCSVNSVTPASSEDGNRVIGITFRMKDGSVRKIELKDCGARNLAIVLDGRKMGLSIREAYAETLRDVCEAVEKGEEFDVRW